MKAVDIIVNGTKVSFTKAFFEGAITINQVVDIDPYNILGEALSLPLVMNAVAILRASAEHRYDVAVFELDILFARLSAEYREEMLDVKVTIAQVEAHVTTTEVYISKKRELLQLKYELKLMDASLRSLQSKDAKVTRLIQSKSIVPEEFEDNLLEDAMKKVREKLGVVITEE